MDLFPIEVELFSSDLLPFSLCTRLEQGGISFPPSPRRGILFFFPSAAKVGPRRPPFFSPFPSRVSATIIDVILLPPFYEDSPPLPVKEDVDLLPFPPGKYIFERASSFSFPFLFKTRLAG